MERLSQQTVNHLIDRWTMLINELNRYGTGSYLDLLEADVLRLTSEAEQVVAPDPFDADLILTARSLIEAGELKIAMFKLHEVIYGRLGGR